MSPIKRILRSLIPAPVLSLYHRALAQLGAIAYGHPSSKLRVFAVTGTKGKSSTTEMLSAIFEADGKRTAILNSIRIKVADGSEPNVMRMSMPGRFYIQRFLARAVAAHCDVAILEMTSEGARQHRQRGIELDGLIFTNLAPEHIESHGSYRAYADAKFEIGRQLTRSHKHPRTMVANAEDEESARYLRLAVENRLPFSLAQHAPYFADERGGYFTFEGKRMQVHISGEFSLRNAIAAATLARAAGTGVDTIARGLDLLRVIPGRAELISAGQDFDVVVDYAHTPDSLEALYLAYAGKRKIAVMGSTGGGRDTWKRPVMGALAAKYCDAVILTDEDPYDEDPRAIVAELASGMERAPEIIMDRRTAIARGLSLAHPHDAVLITGKGTDPNICGPNGEKTPWSDARVAREEIEKMAASKRTHTATQPPTGGQARLPTGRYN